MKCSPEAPFFMFAVSGIVSEKVRCSWGLTQAIDDMHFSALNRLIKIGKKKSHY